MGRFLRQIFQKELDWLRSRFRRLLGIFGSRNASAASRVRKSTSPAASERTPRAPQRKIRSTDGEIRKGTGAGKKSPRSPLAASEMSPPPRRRTLRQRQPRPAIPADRVGPLKREIQHSPSDPFSSVVASMVLHGSLLLVLVPFLIPQEKEPIPVWNLVVRLEEKKKPEKPTPPVPPVEDPQPEIPPEPQPEPTPEPQPEPAEIEEVTDPQELEVIAVGSTSASAHPRLGNRRAQAVARYGGNPSTESAVKAGLDWLVRHQDPDGSWSPDQFDKRCRGSGPTCGGPGYRDHRMGITGLSLLAIVGDGHEPATDGSEYQKSARIALDWILARQDRSGCLLSGQDAKMRNMYDHGIGTFALCEVARWIDDPVVEEAARRALQFIEEAQQPGGGWDYAATVTLRNDLSITGWQLLAIHAGIEAGLLPSATTLASAERFIDRAIASDGSSTYADRGIGRGRKGFGIDAVGLISMISLGHSPLSQRCLAAAQRIANQPPRPDLRAEWDQHPQSMYYWYTATLSLFHTGGEPWQRWNQKLLEDVLPLQKKSGDAMGSWDPDPNWIGAAGGRVAQTALGILTFESYFRYTPMHARLGLTQTPRKR